MGLGCGLGHARLVGGGDGPPSPVTRDRAADLSLGLVLTNGGRTRERVRTATLAQTLAVSATANRDRGRTDTATMAFALAATATKETFTPTMPGTPLLWLDAQDDLLGDRLDRAGEVAMALGDFAGGATGWAAEEGVEAGAGHAFAVQVAEVLETEAEGAVFAQIDELLQDEVAVTRLAVGGEPHELVFAGVDAEAAVMGERGVEQAE